MQAYPRAVPPDPEPSHTPPSGVPSSPSVPAISEQGHSSPEPYWPRLARALTLMVMAVSLHVWAVRSPHPGEPLYATLASRLAGAVIGTTTLPLAPPLPLATSPRQRVARSVTVETTLLNIPPVPGPPVSSPAAVPPPLVAVGTSGTSIVRATDTPDVAPRPAPAALATVENEPAPAATTEPRPGPVVAAMAASPPAAPRLDPAALSLERLAPFAGRGALPADRKEADPRDAADEQRRREEVVLAVLHEYTRALERFDVGATKAIYPSVDDRRLRQSFEDVETQRFQFGQCGVSFSSSGDGASAWCIGNSTFRPRIGSRVIKYSDQAWEFTLARDGGSWQIREARIQ
jgi:hypothetical protein